MLLRPPLLLQAFPTPLCIVRTAQEQETALHFAAYKGRDAMASTLLNAGAAVDVQDSVRNLQQTTQPGWQRLLRH